MKASTPSFVITLKLRYSKAKGKFLDEIFQEGNNLYNRLVEKEFAILQELENLDVWQENTAAVASILGQETLSDEEKKKLLKPYYKERKALLKEYGFEQYEFYKAMPHLRSTPKSIVGSVVEQRIALSVWNKFEAYFYRGGKEVVFRP